MFRFPPTNPEEGTGRFQIITDDRMAYMVYRDQDTGACRALLRGQAYDAHLDPYAGDEKTWNKLRRLVKFLSS
jgi:hypothetical protein